MKSLLLAPLAKNLVLIGLGLLLFGVVGKGLAWVTVVVWVIWRLWQLWGEGRRPLMREEDWTRQMQEVPARVDELLLIETPENEAGPGERERARRELIDQWQAEIAWAKAKYRPPRPLPVRLAEGIGCVGFLMLLPWVMELASSDFVSMRRSYGFADAGFFLVCLGLYALPLLRRLQGWPVAAFWIWWVLPTVSLVPTAAFLLQNRHPYLDPLNPQRVRLAAEKVLGHRDFIVASDHADWVVEHAGELARQGEKERAVELCQEALRMNPSLRAGSVLLSALRGGQTEDVTPEHVGAPYVEAGVDIPVMPRCGIEDAVEGAPRCTVVLLPMGEVDARLLDHVAFVLQRETGLRTKVYGKTLPLPEATRMRGLMVGRQWDATPLVEAMSAETSGRRVRGRLQILVVTSADIYMGDANYVFAANYDWGSVVSLARFSENAGGALLRHRAAKLCYGSLIKSLGVPAAADWRCVTSYSASLGEFDAKGNRPIPETQRLLDGAIERVNREWLQMARQ